MWFLRNGCFTHTILSKTYTRFVLFYEKFGLKSGGLYTDTIDGIWGENTDAAVDAFETRSVQIAASLGTFDARTERNIQTLHLRAQEAARAFMNAVRAAGINARIISGTRTYVEQNTLYRKGRFGNPPPRVTNARGGQSNHNFGIAWDIGIFTPNGAYLPESPLYNQAAQAGFAAGIMGLEWGRIGRVLLIALTTS